MFNDRIWSGVESLLDAYAQVRPGDVAVLLYTSDSHEPAAWISAGLEVRGIEVRRLWMAPLVDPGFAARLATTLGAGPIPGRLVLFSVERDTLSHTNELHAALARFPAERRRVLRMISATAEVFEDTLAATPSQLSALNAGLLDALMPAQRLRITTEGGTDMTLRLDHARRWISNRGTARPGGTVVLPAGEVATCPADAEGLFVADFAFNINTITGRDARLNHAPVRVRLAAGRAVAVQCDDPVLQRFLDDCFAMEHATRIGELGFGTNPGVAVPIAFNSHRNERCCGVHLGFGQHNQDEALMGYQARVHLDLIARGGLVWVDDAAEPLDLAQLQPSARPHPLHARDEDVFAPDSEEPLADLAEQDCCGLIGAQGLRQCEV
jgi:hypothetical protein